MKLGNSLPTKIIVNCKRKRTHAEAKPKQWVGGESSREKKGPPTQNWQDSRSGTRVDLEPTVRRKKRGEKIKGRESTPPTKTAGRGTCETPARRSKFYRKSKSIHNAGRLATLRGRQSKRGEEMGYCQAEDGRIGERKAFAKGGARKQKEYHSPFFISKKKDPDKIPKKGLALKRVSNHAVPV